MKSGQVVFEDYYLGTIAANPRTGWLLSKSFVSALAGVILTDGDIIAALDDPVTSYAPQLAGRAYEDTTVRHLVNMATGVILDEDDLDHHSDINRMGRVLALCGLNMTPRDDTRFGQMVAQGGCWLGVQIVSEDWLGLSKTASAPIGGHAYGYGDQWWMPVNTRPREYMARGIYGQSLYIDGQRETVIVPTAADPAFRDRRVQDARITFFRQIAETP